LVIRKKQQVLHSDEKRHWWESVNGIIKDENKPQWQEACWELEQTTSNYKIMYFLGDDLLSGG
jgi:hypothetical protein